MQDEDGATVQVLLGENARVAGRDYVEISKLSVNDLKTLLTLLPRPIADDIVIRSAPAFHALYGFAADNSDEQRRQVVDIRNRTGYGEGLIRRLKWTGALRLTDHGAYLAPSYVNEAMSCFQIVSFLLLFVISLMSLLFQPTLPITLFPAMILFISSQLGFAVLSHWAIFQPSRIARRGLQPLAT